jgi:hypothetical protein
MLHTTDREVYAVPHNAYYTLVIVYVPAHHMCVCVYVCVIVCVSVC